LKAIVLIKSCHRHAERRSACLDTWLPRLDWADYLFLIGQPTPAQGAPVEVNSLACNVSDEFPNIAPKIRCGFLYALESGCDFAFVCDDDTYVVPERLRQSGYWRHDYVGFLRVNGLEYNGNRPYMQGSAYWISARAMRYAVANPLLQRNGIIDDGAVGQALYGNVPYVHDDRYFVGPECLEGVPERTNKIITTHKCLPKQMRAVHDLWRRECAN